MNLLPEAIAWHNAGATPIPTRADGSKAPAVTWRQWEHTQPPLADIINAFTNTDTDGLGLICGAASGQLEMLELEGRAINEGWLPRLEEAFDDHGPEWRTLWDRVAGGYAERTPSGGLHYYYRVDGPAAPNTKLASRPTTDTDNTTARIVVMIETRGQGGFTVIAPSSGRTHKTGHPWEVIAGNRDTIPTLTVEERDALHAIAATLDETPAQEWTNTPRPASTPPSDDLKPGEDFNARGDWQFLADAGWQPSQRFPGGRIGWTRPGKNPADGISATTGGAHDGEDRLYVFSSSTEFETERPYTRFGAYTWLLHGGDFAAAARALRAEGYGSDQPEPAPELTLTTLDAAGTTQPAATPGESLLDRLIREEVLRLKARTAAREIVAAATAPPAEPFDLDTLREVLTRPAEPPMRIDRLMPWEASTLFIAQRKTGKTTAELNLARCLLTGEPFLGTFDVIPVDGTVALMNYEVSARQIATWADEHGVDADRLVLVNLRGRRNPLGHAPDRDRLADLLRARNVETVIVDPFGRAYTGQSQNDAGEVGAWLVGLDQFVRSDIGARDLILTAHAGWNGERTRGSSALEDWADVLITLTRDNDDDEKPTPDRYFRAEGRDVEIPEDRLIFDAPTRTLTLAGSGGRKKEREHQRASGLTEPIMAIVEATPGIGRRDLERRLREALGGVRGDDITTAIKFLVSSGRAHVIDNGPGKPKPIHPGQQPLTFGKAAS